MARLLEDIPIADRDITLSHLEELNANGGALRVESNWKLPIPIQRQWPMRTVMFHKGCVYIFKTEKQKSESQFTLYGYTNVEKLEDIKKNPLYRYAFVVRNHQKDADLDLVFAGVTEKDREKWMGFFKQEIKLANAKAQPEQQRPIAPIPVTRSVSYDSSKPDPNTVSRGAKLRSLPRLPPASKSVEDTLGSYIPMTSDHTIFSEPSRSQSGSNIACQDDADYVDVEPCGEAYICEYDLKEDCVFSRAYSSDKSVDIFAEFPNLREDGTFYVRDSQAKAGEMTLIVYAKTKGRKFKMIEKGSNFHLQQDQGQSFDSPNSLLEYYMAHPIPSQEIGQVKLNMPYKDHPFYQPDLVPLY